MWGKKELHPYNIFWVLDEIWILHKNKKGRILNTVGMILWCWLLSIIYNGFSIVIEREQASIYVYLLICRVVLSQIR